MTPDDSDFESRAARILEDIMDAVDGVLGDHLDVDLLDGVLTIELDDGGQYVINRHAPLRQIWVSSPASGASHYAYDAESGEWISTRGGANLFTLLSAELSRATGVAFKL